MFALQLGKMNDDVIERNDGQGKGKEVNHYEMINERETRNIRNGKRKHETINDS